MDGLYPISPLLLPYTAEGLAAFPVLSLADIVESAVEPGHPLCMIGRSEKWPAVRKQFLAAHPACCVSGLRTNLEVHHVQPFHLHPELELDWSNLRTVSRPYHFLVGHLCDWKSTNTHFDEHAAEWRGRIARRREAV